ncbi:hypothetical protein QCA50_014691 [Cerrena zonata]|uniref:Uncharacterized protein n=1 Tax=Cerrena zonata TaxID=2478898 RepID=A0AAW0FZB5_9APHY
MLMWLWAEAYSGRPRPFRNARACACSMAWIAGSEAEDVKSASQTGATYSWSSWRVNFALGKKDERTSTKNGLRTLCRQSDSALLLSQCLHDCMMEEEMGEIL